MFDATVAARALARLSRRYRYSHPPFHLVGKAAGRAVRQLSGLVCRDDIPYMDISGFLRSANLRDDLETQDFIGAGKLPAVVGDLVRANDWVVDVGANIGIVTSQLCRLVGPRGKVWAVEPVPRNVRRLEALASTNDLRHLAVFEAALGHFTGTADIRLPVTGQSGWASFTKSWDVANSVSTQIWRLDDLIHAHDPGGRISFIKIDVEGFEPQVLQGARCTLQVMRPFVLCEFNDILLRDAAFSSGALLGAFAELGYRPMPGWRLSPADLRDVNCDLLLSPSPT